MESGIVPEEWQRGKVKDLIARLDSGVSVNGEERDMREGEIGVLKVSAISYGAFIPSQYKTVTKEEVGRARVTPKKGQIIISRSNTEALVGASAYIEADWPSLFLPDKLWQTVPRPAVEFDMKWLAYLLSAPHARCRLSKLATGTSGSMKNITKDELLSLDIEIPPTNEQQKIARILSIWDKAIENVEKLIENSKKQKKALMQQLLTGTVRISGHGEEWKPREFSEIANLSKAKWTPRSTTESMPCVELEHLSQFTGQRLGSISSREQRSAKNLFRPGEVLFGKLRPYLRKYWLADMPGVCSTEIWVLQVNREVCSPEYLFYLVQSERFIASCHVTSGSKMPRADWAYVSSFPFLLPSLKEQRVISTVLKIPDQTIGRLSKKLTLLKAEKTALMQQLLTGKRRVKIDPKER